jgi:hypothetical protein
MRTSEGLKMTNDTRPLIRQHLCDNCLMPMTSQFCSQCGQKKVSQSKHFRILLGEFIEDVLNFDDKIMRTFKPLLFKPGFLSKEYFANRRMLYVSPLKLYFFISVITFFLIQYSIESVIEDKNLTTISNGDGTKAEKTERSSISFNDKPWDAKTNPINESWLPEVGNTMLNDRVAKFKELMKSDDYVKQLIHTALAVAPQTLLILLPFFAFLLKLVYFFQKRLYIEHLIVGLHNHAFLLVSISAGVVFSEIGSWLSPYPWALSFGEYLNAVIIIWVPVYFLLSLKTVYRQSWWRTIFKFLLIAFFYLFLLIFGLVITILLGFLFL